MISFLGLVFALIFPLIIGMSVLSVLLGRIVLPLLERLALSFLIGTGLLSFSLFLFALAGIKFYFISIFLFWAAILIAINVYLMQKRISFLVFDTLPFRKMSWLEKLLTGLIGLKLLYASFHALVYPVYVWDTLWNWFFRAKVFFYQRMLPLSGEITYRLGGGMQQYPLHIPFLATWVALCMQRWDDFWVKIIFPAFFLCLILVFYYGVKFYSERTYGLFFTLLLTAMPLLVYHASVPYADLMVGIYFLAAGIYLWRWITEGQNAFLLISALLGVGGAWTKDEGLVLYGALFFTLLLYLLFQKRGSKLAEKAKTLGNYLIFLLPYALFWLGFKFWQGVSFGNDPKFKGEGIFSAFGFFPQSLWVALEESFSTASHGLLFALLVLVILFCAKEIFLTRKKYLLLMPLLAWCFYLFLYSFTYNSGMVLNKIIQHRNCLTFTPLLLYALAVVLWDKYLEIKSSYASATISPWARKSSLSASRGYSNRVR